MCGCLFPQVRQRVDHKRTFLHLEQLILKHHAHQHALQIQVRTLNTPPSLQERTEFSGSVRDPINADWVCRCGVCRRLRTAWTSTTPRGIRYVCKTAFAAAIHWSLGFEGRWAQPCIQCVVAFPLVRFAEHCLCPLGILPLQGARFAEFLETVCPCTVKYSKKLVSQDDHSNTFNYKYTSVIEIVPVRPWEEYAKLEGINGPPQTAHRGLHHGFVLTCILCVCCSML